MLKVKQFVFNPFGECTYVVSDEKTGQSIVVDPGMTDQAERDRLDKYIVDNKLEVTGIVNTHMHLDHCFGVNYVRDRYGAPVKAHPADAPLGAAIGKQGRRFGLRGLGDSVAVDVPLADGDTIALGDEKLHVLHVPGHSPGGIALYSPDGRFVLTGDSLFKGSVAPTSRAATTPRSSGL